jgi:hypothetical protein
MFMYLNITIWPKASFTSFWTLAIKKELRTRIGEPSDRVNSLHACRINRGTDQGIRARNTAAAGQRSRQREAKKQKKGMKDYSATFLLGKLLKL